MSQIIVKVHNGYFYKGQKSFTTNSGKTLSIKATSGASYELVQNNLAKAPEEILIEKRGNDLLVAFDDKNQVELVIQDYFLYPDSQLVGLNSMGEYYSYLPVQDKYEEFFGKDLWLGNEQENGAQRVRLGSYGKITPWLLEAESQPMFDTLKPALMGVGASALLLFGVESLSKKDTNTSDPAPLPKPPAAPTEATVSDDGMVITGKALADVTVQVFYKGKQLGSAKADADGKFTITLDEAKTSGENLSVVAVNKGVSSKPLNIVTVDKQAPEPVSSKEINDSGTLVSGKAEPNAKITVLDENGNVLGEGTVDKLGNYRVALRQAQNHEEMLKIKVTDAAGNESELADLKGAKGANTSISNIVDIDKTSTTNSVKEDAKVGTKVGITAKASDYEEVTYSLVNDATGHFVIDSKTGVVTTAKTLDFENKEQYMIRVRANSADGTNVEKSFLVKVENINDNKISDAQDVDAKANVVAINAAAGSTVGVTVKATDADKSPVTYRILDNPDDLFSIGVSSGVITTAKSLDGNAGNQVVKVQAISTDGTTSDLEVTINVQAASNKPFSAEAYNNVYDDKDTTESAFVSDIANLLQGNSVDTSLVAMAKADKLLTTSAIDNGLRLVDVLPNNDQLLLLDENTTSNTKVSAKAATVAVAHKADELAYDTSTMHELAHELHVMSDSIL